MARKKLVARTCHSAVLLLLPPPSRARKTATSVRQRRIRNSPLDSGVFSDGTVRCRRDRSAMADAEDRPVGSPAHALIALPRSAAPGWRRSMYGLASATAGPSRWDQGAWVRHSPRKGYGKICAKKFAKKIFAKKYLQKNCDGTRRRTTRKCGSRLAMRGD